MRKNIGIRKQTFTYYTHQTTWRMRQTLKSMARNLTDGDRQTDKHNHRRDQQMHRQIQPDTQPQMRPSAILTTTNEVDRPHNQGHISSSSISSSKSERQARGTYLRSLWRYTTRATTRKFFWKHTVTDRMKRERLMEIRMILQKIEEWRHRGKQRLGGMVKQTNGWNDKYGHNYIRNIHKQRRDRQKTDTPSGRGNTSWERNPTTKPEPVQWTSQGRIVALFRNWGSWVRRIRHL